MLKALTAQQARMIAMIAKATRTERDAVLGNVAEAELADVVPGRGEHNPTAALGFEPLSPEDLQPAGLRDAVTSLSSPARQELYALMRMGQGHLALKNWHRGLTEAETLGEAAITDAIVDDPDLHDHLAKGLYEAKLSP